jgi:hypothetical protein
MYSSNNIDALSWDVWGPDHVLQPNVLLAPKGDDFSMVKESERESNDLSCLTYNLKDNMILRQFEEAAAPAKYLCQFLQDKKYTWSHVLFTI